MKDAVQPHPYVFAKDGNVWVFVGVCYRMMQQMEGDIEVESVTGEYTRFTLTFQRAEAKVSTPASSKTHSPTS